MDARRPACARRAARNLYDARTMRSRESSNRLHARRARGTRRSRRASRAYKIHASIRVVVVVFRDRDERAFGRIPSFTRTHPSSRVSSLERGYDRARSIGIRERRRALSDACAVATREDAPGDGGGRELRGRGHGWRESSTSADDDDDGPRARPLDRPLDRPLARGVWPSVGPLMGVRTSGIRVRAVGAVETIHVPSVSPRTYSTYSSVRILYEHKT